MLCKGFYEVNRIVQYSTGVFENVNVTSACMFMGVVQGPVKNFLFYYVIHNKFFIFKFLLRLLFIFINFS